ncbi:MAG TPA: site-specific integrase [Candidatus Binatia bacterium]|nr:site-specific integrase [Candidatus Binatia bacterium]
MLLKRGRIWHSRIKFQGQTHARTLRTSSKAEAQRLEAVFKSSLIRGEFSIIDSRNAPTFTEFEERVLAHIKVKVAEPRTYGFYKENYKALKRYTPLASAKLPHIDKALIDSFVQFRLKDQVTSVTVNHSLRTLRRVLYIAQEWKLVREVPTIELLPNEHQREAVIDDSTLDRMVKYLRTLYPKGLMHDMLPFLVDTGLRITECCNLKKQHISYEDLKPYKIRIVKGKSKFAKRDIVLTQRASAALDSALKKSRSEWAFTKRGGRNPLTRHYPSEQFRIVRDALNLGPEYVLHSTRHTFCTRLGKAGVDAFRIQKLAGHSSITISQRYVHPDADANESAIRLLDVLNATPAPVPSDRVKEI